MSDSLQAVRAELDRWPSTGPRATFWLRDDDATRPDPRLERLLASSARGHVPLVLAVIPEPTEPALADALAPFDRVIVAQHGIGHHNRAVTDREKKIELGGQADDDAILDSLAHSQNRMRALFGRRWAPILVPPWNRIRASLVPRLPELGYAVLSRFRSPPAEPAVPGLSRWDTHLDIVDWRGGRGFVGREQAEYDLVRHLTARRDNAVDPNQATGILCHHWTHDAGCWDFLQALMDLVAAHPVARWTAPEVRT